MTTYREFLGGKLIFHISGELDESNISDAKISLDKGIEQRPAVVVLDLSRMTFIDSTAIGMILSRYRKLKSLGIPLCVKGLGAQTEKVFRTSGLLTIIPVVG